MVPRYSFTPPWTDVYCPSSIRRKREAIETTNGVEFDRAFVDFLGESGDQTRPVCRMRDPSLTKTSRRVKFCEKGGCAQLRRELPDP